MLRSSLFFAGAALALASAGAPGQVFDLDWNTIDAGGGLLSDGAGLELHGTIGQPDAGVALTGGGYEVVGGFWVAPMPTGNCQDIDFNNDGVFPDTQDIIDFFDVFAGATCGACDTIDFNNDGVFPDNQDISDLLNVFAGGTCP